jgi:hypothetical protein
MQLDILVSYHGTAFHAIPLFCDLSVTFQRASMHGNDQDGRLG